MNIEKYTYTATDVAQGALQEVSSFEQTDVKCNSQAIMLAGQPAVGKSVITARFTKEYYNIDADDYRVYHPAFNVIEEKEGKDAAQYTGKFAGEVCERLIDQLTDKKANIIIQGTGRNFETPYKTATQLKEKGYSINLYVVACPVKVSTASIFKRYYEMLENGEVGRFSNIEHTKTVLENLPKNIDKLYQTGLFNRMYIVNRKGECLWDNLTRRKPSEILIHEFIRPLTNKEQEWISQAKEVILKNAVEADKEIQNMEQVMHNIHEHVKNRYRVKVKAQIQFPKPPVSKDKEITR